ncbi:hypothetical protein [Ectothiorhodospira variabilis]|uniref:hypothetical protein n=1 Tax=Ectothiorhodospira variabilis TaxID=505694 RepID=UPI001EFB3381|nr:hypothetical protein [Ectothiorhodospira variabilis]MCG5499142.1 hypothetical protein [Ectothiorhodospira variabilis]
MESEHAAHSLDPRNHAAVCALLSARQIPAPSPAQLDHAICVHGPNKVLRALRQIQAYSDHRAHGARIFLKNSFMERPAPADSEQHTPDEREPDGNMDFHQSKSHPQIHAHDHGICGYSDQAALRVLTRQDEYRRMWLEFHIAPGLPLHSAGFREYAWHHTISFSLGFTEILSMLSVLTRRRSGWGFFDDLGNCDQSFHVSMENGYHRFEILTGEDKLVIQFTPTDAFRLASIILYHLRCNAPGTPSDMDILRLMEFTMDRSSDPKKS